MVEMQGSCDRVLALRSADLLQTADTHPSSNLNERGQLKVLFSRLTDTVDLVEYFTPDAAFIAFMKAKHQDISGVQNISFSNDNKTLANEVAVRVSAIRNRVVHAKRAEAYRESPPLWPTSEEASLLGYDVALVRWLAQRALVQYSSSA